MKNVFPIIIGLAMALGVFLVGVWYLNINIDYSAIESPINLTEAVKVQFKKFESPTDLAEFDELKKTIDQVPGTYGLYIKDLQTGKEYKYNEGEIFYGASLYKIPIGNQTLRQIFCFETVQSAQPNVIKNGDPKPCLELKFEDEVVYTEIDFTNGSGSIAESDYGTVYTIEELLNKLYKESDNVAQNMLIRTLTEDYVKEEFKRLSPTPNSRFYDENETSPTEVSGIIEKAFNETSPGFENIFNIMTKTSFDSEIHAGLKEDTIYSHKIGSFGEKGVWHDCGVVLGNPPTIVCLMSKDTNRDAYLGVAKLVGEFLEKHVLY